MKAMSKGLNFGKSIADNGGGEFIGFLQYKLEQEGLRMLGVQLEEQTIVS